MNATAPSRRQEEGGEPDQRRGAILAAAQRLFATRPTSEVTIGDVAVAAGVDRATVRERFGSMRELYVAVYLAVASDLADAAKSVVRTDLDDLPQEEIVRRNAAALLDFVETHRSALAVFLWRDGPEDPAIEALRDEVTETMIDRALINNLGTADVPESVRFVLRAHAGLFEAALREWLVRGRADRAEVEALFVAGVLSAVQRVAPAVVAATERTEARTRSEAVTDP